MESISVNGIEYQIIRLLGKGKGGYSYLAEREGKQVVLKQIHHEPCEYYTFGNKIKLRKTTCGACSTRISASPRCSI